MQANFLNSLRFNMYKIMESKTRPKSVRSLVSGWLGFFFNFALFLKKKKKISKSFKVYISRPRAEMVFVPISASLHISRKLIWLLRKATVLLASASAESGPEAHPPFSPRQKVVKEAKSSMLWYRSQTYGNVRLHETAFNRCLKKDN